MMEMKLMEMDVGHQIAQLNQCLNAITRFLTFAENNVEMENLTKQQENSVMMEISKAQMAVVQCVKLSWAINVIRMLVQMYVQQVMENLLVLF